MRYIFRHLFWGALAISVLIFIIVPYVFHVNVIEIFNSPKWQEIAEPWKEVPDKIKQDTLGSVGKSNPSKNVKKESDEEFIRKDRVIWIPIALVGFAIISYGAYYLFMRSRNKVLASQLVYYQAIPFGDFNLADMSVAQGFLRSLSQNMRQPWDAIILGQPWFRYIIKKNAGDGLIELFFGVPEDRTEPFLNSFSGYYNKVQLIRLNKAQMDTLIPERKNYKVSTFALLTKDPLPIRVFEGKAGEPDPINIILNGTGGGKPSDIDVIIDIILRPVSESTHLYKVGSKFMNNLRDSRSDSSDIPGLLAGIGSGEGAETKKQKTMSEFEKDYMKAVKDRSTAPEKAFSTSIRLYATGDGKDDLLMALKSTSDSFSSLNAFNSLVSEPVLNAWRMKRKIKEGRLGINEGFVLSTSELMSFVRIPDAKIDAFSMLNTIDAKAVRAPQSIRSEDVSNEEMFLINMDDPDSVMQWAEEWEANKNGPSDDIAPATQQERLNTESTSDDSSMGLDNEETASALSEFDKKIQEMQASTSKPEPTPESKPESEGFDFGDDSNGTGYDF